MNEHYHIQRASAPEDSHTVRHGVHMSVNTASLSAGNIQSQVFNADKQAIIAPEHDFPHYIGGRQS